MSKKIGTVSDSVKNSTVKTRDSNRRRSVMPKILCVLAAFVLWIYVMQVESPEYTDTINSIPVEMENISKLQSESKLSIYSGGNQFVNVSVSGKRSVISRLSSDSIRAFIDVGTVTEPGRHSLDVYVELPDGIILKEPTPSTVTVFADETAVVSLPVKERLLNLALASPYELGTVDLEYTTISVAGPKNKINSISNAMVNVNMDGKTSSFTANCPIILYGGNGEVIDNTYLSMSITDMNVTVPIYVTREVQIETEFKYGLLDSSLVRVTCSPETVTVRGDESVFENGGLFANTIVIDEKKIGNNIYTMRVVPTFVGGEVSVDPEDEEVIVTIELDESLKTKRFSITDIQVIGASEDVKYQILDDSIDVTIRGDVAALNSLKTSDISAVIDLSGYDRESSGTVSKNVSIVVNSDDGKKMFEVGTYSVQVRIY